MSPFKKFKKFLLLMTNQQSQYAHFYFENEKANYIECGINFTVREFLDKAKQKLNSRDDYDNENNFIPYYNIHCVYIKGRKIEEECLLKDYFDDLKKVPIIITKDPTKLIENTLPSINLDDYEILSLFSSISGGYSFKAIDKHTNKEVLIYSFGIEDVISNFEIVYQYKIPSTLDHCGIIKVIGFRYP